jgi:hypothetical protein
MGIRVVQTRFASGKRAYRVSNEKSYLHSNQLLLIGMLTRL